MARKQLSLLVIVLSSATVLFLWFILLDKTVHHLSENAQAANLDAPLVMGVAPTSAPNDLDTPIVITGTGFTDGVSGTLASLSSNSLTDVTWVNSTTLSATVPWGLDEGIYTLTVVNPEGGTGLLTNAFTVTQGIGVWTSGGPYGGCIVDIVLDPFTPSRMYAMAGGIGLFISSDAAVSWQPLWINPMPTRLAIDSHQPNVMYIGGSNSLYRTQDGGQTWEIVRPQGAIGNSYFRPVAHPTMADTVYLAVEGDGGIAPEGVFKSSDRGTTWITMTAGLTDTDVAAIAFHPQDADRMYLTTGDGDVFYSTNGGALWNWAAHLAPVLGRLYVNPFGAHELWALGQAPGTAYGVFRSTDPSLANWEQVTGAGKPDSLTFHPTISGTLWAAADAGYVSRDDGETWQPVGVGLPPGGNFMIGALNFAVDVTLNPITPTLYAGTGEGVYKSLDGGATWQETNQGMTANFVWAVAASPHDVEEVYASTASRGVLRSTNGGHSWQALDVPSPGWSANLVVDPVLPERVYLSCVENGQPCVRISPDSGESWQTIQLTIPYTDGWGGRTFAVSPDPGQAGRVLAGVGFYPPGWENGWVTPQGGIYLSQDYGESWANITVSMPISHVNVLTFDPVNSQVVYAGTLAGGLLKSIDSGDTWEQVSSFPTMCDVNALALDPVNSGWIFASSGSGRSNPECENATYVSSNGGQTWTRLEDPAVTSGPVFALAFANSDPPTLYCGTFGNGVWFSNDRGQTWNVAAGMSQGDVRGLATATDGERVIVYIGISGSVVTLPGLLNQESVSGTTLLGSGVFRLTTLPGQRVYLPLVSMGGTQ